MGDESAIRLIINADDYGYSVGISRGILKAAKMRAICATGIFANSPDLLKKIAWLAAFPDLDLGVHLNLTFRQPTTKQLADLFPNAQFPCLHIIIGLILSGRISLDCVQAEWRAQIEALLSLGVKLEFLNSHQHIHMLPNLFPLAQALAREYQIPHLRLTTAEWLPPWSGAAVLRNAMLQAMAAVNKYLHQAEDFPRFIGLGRSGKLDLVYLKKLFSLLKPGKVYELMCHPGQTDSNEITEPKLLAYHAWQQELSLFTGPHVKKLYQQLNIKIINYRSLSAHE